MSALKFKTAFRSFAARIRSTNREWFVPIRPNSRAFTVDFTDQTDEGNAPDPTSEASATEVRFDVLGVFVASPSAELSSEFFGPGFHVGLLTSAA